MVPGIDDGPAVSMKTVSDFNVFLYVRDCTSPPTIRYHTFILPANIATDDLLAQVAERASLKSNNVSLFFIGLGQAGSTELCLNDSHCSLIEALSAVNCQPDCKLYFMVTLNDDAAAASRSKGDGELSPIEYSPQNNSCDSSSSPLPCLAESISLPGGDPSLASSTVVDDRTAIASHSECSTAVTDSNHAIVEVPAAKRFVGLVNQAMTCYLNSLIQTLFMTPEFRNAVYLVDPSDLADETSRSRSIPYQLQRLFLRLQFSNRQAVETTALTTSFGWDTSEVWEQHDVQELCRILLDALEAAWRGTDKSDLIDRLYQGKMEDYVQCLACNHCSSRVAKYQDISLAIRSFDAQFSYGTLHEALAAFTKPEILSDDNKYYCDQCHEKQDACKGLRFQSFPRVVTMQLKRFDFDYRFGNRVKLNDRIFFPNFINLDSYIAHEKLLHNGTVMVQSEQSYLTENGGGCKQPQDSHASDEVKEDAAKLLDMDDPDDSSACRYELFSVLVHSGSASGGHYYAYIKNFDDGAFYCFNDRVVRRVPDEEVKLTYGSGTGSSSAYSYSTSAYMLMYRLCDKAKPTHFMTLDEMQAFPWLLKQIDEINRGEVTVDSCHHSASDGMLSKANKYEDISMASTLAAPTYTSTATDTNDGTASPYAAITVFYIHPDDCIATPTRVRLPPTTTLVEAADIVVKELNLDKVLQQSSVRYRLVPYNNYTKVFGILDPVSTESALPSTEETDECVNVQIGDLNKSSNMAFFLEVLPIDMPFRRFSCGSVTLIVNLVDGSEMRVSKSAITAVPPTWTVGKIGSYVCKLLSLPNPYVRMGIVERNWPSDDTIRHLIKLDSTLEREKLIDPPLDLYVENLSESEDTLFPFRRTTLYRYVDFQINTIQLTVSVRFDRPNIPVISVKTDELVNTAPGDLKEIPISVSSSQLVLLDGSQHITLPPPSSTSIDGYLVKCAYSKSDDDSVVVSAKADKRLAVQDLAQVIASDMGFDPCSTVIWRDFGGHCEEQLRSALSLEFISTSSRLSLRSGRVLTENEYVVNVYQMEDAVKKFGQPLVERFSVVVENEWKIFRLKEIVATFLKRQYGIEACIGTAKPDEFVKTCGSCSGSKYHLRLRRNRFSEPSRILASAEVLGKDCEWSSVKDIFFELLCDGPEVKQNVGDLVVKALHWHPSQLSLDTPVEVCISGRTSTDLMTKLSSQFKIDGENIEVASCSSATTHVSLLDLQDHVRWNSISTVRDVDVYPLMLHEDGALFYLRDKTEELAQIDAERRRQIISQEGGTTRSYNGTSNSLTSTLSSSLRDRTSRPKEKSLKIYTHQSSPPPSLQPPGSVISIPAPPATTPTNGCPSLPAVISPPSVVADAAVGDSDVCASLMEVDKPGSSVVTDLDVD